MKKSPTKAIVAQGVMMELGPKPGLLILKFIFLYFILYYLPKT